MLFKKIKSMSDKKQTTDIDIKKEAISLVNGEWRAYEDAVVYVTDKVAFNVRNLIKTLRKNYWGIFDDDKDPVSGKKLTWIGITEWICDTWVKNSDRDSKDIQVKSKNGKVGLVSLVRHLVTNWLDNNIFGETLDETERQLAIDGSHIWKTFKGYDEDGKVCMIREDVDLLNAYFDMTSKSIQKAYRFTERALLTPSQIEEMDGWMDTKGLKGGSGLHPTDTNLSSTNPSDTVKYIDVWETWGYIPKYLITGNKNDTKEVQGHIVVSNLQGGKENARVHLIETNPKGLKPYEEAHTKKILGRWLGRGPAESVMMLQSWINMIVNIRKIRHQVSQLGIFKLRKGSGVAPQNISRMAANGVIAVNGMDDVEQFVMQEASQSSYKDEDIAVNWAQRITSSYEAVTGELMPTSQTATGIVVQKNAATSSFIMFKKQIGFFLERWLKRHAIPILTEMVTIGEVIRMTGEVNELEQFDELMVNYLASKKLDELEKKGVKVDELQVVSELQKAINKFKKLGRDRFIKIVKDINLTEYDVLVYTNDEKIDPGMLANNLLSVLKIAPQYQEPVMKYLFDLMGLDVNQFQNIQQVQQPQQPQQLPAGQQAPITNPTPQQQFTKANVPA